MLTDCCSCFQSQTEWQAFQRNSLEIVAKLAELLPGETFSLLVRIYDNNAEERVGIRGENKGVKGWQLDGR